MAGLGSAMRRAQELCASVAPRLAFQLHVRLSAQRASCSAGLAWSKEVWGAGCCSGNRKDARVYLVGSYNVMEGRLSKHVWCKALSTASPSMPSAAARARRASGSDQGIPAHPASWAPSAHLTRAGAMPSPSASWHM